MTEPNTGWFADLSDEGERDERWPWQPFVQVPGCCFPLPVWFATEQECEDYIRRELVGLGVLDR